jgi:hypothetical protein
MSDMCPVRNLTVHNFGCGISVQKQESAVIRNIVNGSAHASYF